MCEVKKITAERERESEREMNLKAFSKSNQWDSKHQAVQWSCVHAAVPCD